MRKTAIILAISFLQAKAFHLLNRFHVQLSSRANPLHSDVKEIGRPPKSKQADEEVSKFLTDFRTAQGNLVNPYKVLKVPRDASISDIKSSYRNLSRKWHPDAVARKEILPGKCANLEEVREEWEKVKLSYEILQDRKTRMKYDRNSVVADPGAAVGRAVGSAVGGVLSWSVESVFKIVAGDKDAGDSRSNESRS